jgi:hypothetical protein
MDLENCFRKLCWKMALENGVGKRHQETTWGNSVGKMVSKMVLEMVSENSIGK